MKAYDAAMSAPWAMLPESVEQLLEIAARENDPTQEALEAYRASRADNGERLTVRGNVGILDAKGPMFKRANLMTAFSGATSYEVLRRDLQVALDDPGIDAIMLRMDTPGGEVSACDELATAIYEARARKPIVAFVSGQAASAGYWLAAAADKIIVSDAAMLGSIGVVLGITDRKKADERAGVSRIEYVSSQSPGKRPDHGTDEGKAKVQKLVDDMGAVFVSAVAKYRGVSVDHVLAKFGAGGMEIGANAVALGMADELGQFEAALSRLAMRGRNRRFIQRSTGSFFMTTNTETADIAKLTAEAVAKAQTEERGRIAAIHACDSAKVLPKLAALLVSGGIAADVAVSYLDAAAADTKIAVDAKAAAPALKTEAEKSAEFESKKKAEGALGLGMPDSTESQRTANTGWGKAVTAANSGLN